MGRKSNAGWFATAAALFVIAAWISNYLLLRGFSATERGTFGDMFGAVNAVFSGMAFVGVVYAIFLQRSEMAIAREELGQTKTILDKQQEQIANQNDATRHQAFENTFFQLLGVLTDITHSLDVSKGTAVYRGKDVFGFFVRQLSQSQNVLTDELKRLPKSIEIYEHLYAAREGDLGHYFRSLYTVLKFVDQSKSTTDKKFYTNIVRAQLSNDELVLLLYNGLSSAGKHKLKPLLERYEIFDNLPINKIPYPDVLRDYDSSAFGANEAILQIFSEAGH